MKRQTKKSRNIEDMEALNELQEIEETCMSNTDINKYFPGVKTVSYCDLAGVGNINELLPRPGSFFFLLYQNSPNSGHWVALLRGRDYIEYFDSYGGPIDGPLDWLTARQNKALGIVNPYLSKLLMEHGGEIQWNGVCFQNPHNSGISTCGRHCCLRIKMFLNGYDLEKYIRLLQLTKKKTLRNFDEIVAGLITE